MILSPTVLESKIDGVLYKLQEVNPQLGYIDDLSLRFILTTPVAGDAILQKLEEISEKLGRMVNAMDKMECIQMLYRMHLRSARVLVPQHIFDIEDYQLEVDQYKQPIYVGPVPSEDDFDRIDLVQRFSEYFKVVMRNVCAPTANAMINKEALFMRQCDDLIHALVNNQCEENVQTLTNLVVEVQFLRKCFMEAEAAFLANMENVVAMLKNRVEAIEM